MSIGIKIEDKKLLKWLHGQGADEWAANTLRMHQLQEYPINEGAVFASSAVEQQVPTQTFRILTTSNILDPKCKETKVIEFTMPVKALSNLEMCDPDNHITIAQFIVGFGFGFQKFDDSGMILETLNGMDFCVYDSPYDDLNAWKEGRSEQVLQAYYIDAFNVFHFVQKEALKSYKKIESIKKYEKHDVPIGEKIDRCKPIKLNSDISVYYQVDDDTIRKYERHIESWRVRGHYRHYKNGRTIFINSYKKGNGIEKDTLYTI